VKIVIIIIDKDLYGTILLGVIMNKIFFYIFLLSILYSENLSRTQVIMGTFCTIEIENNNNNLIDKGFKNLKDSEAILSSYRNNALLYKLNKQRIIESNLALEDILIKSKEYYQLTGGYFDITIGSITKELYHFKLNINSIKLEKNYIKLEDNITLDLGGIGKGYAVDRLSSYYHKLNLSNVKIALSGDIRCFNRCSIDIQSPFNENKIIATIKSKVKNLSISTSGKYRRYVKSKKYHHLIDPKLKTQSSSFASVTIITQNNNTLCDAMATAISVMPLDKALEFVKSQKSFGYFLVTNNKEIIQGNLEDLIIINDIDTNYHIK